MKLPHPCLALFGLVATATAVVLVVYFAGGAWWLTEQVDESDIGGSDGGGDISTDSSSSDAWDDAINTKLPPRGVIALCVIGTVFVLAGCLPTEDR